MKNDFEFRAQCADELHRIMDPKSPYDRGLTDEYGADNPYPAGSADAVSWDRGYGEAHGDGYDDY